MDASVYAIIALVWACVSVGAAVVTAVLMRRGGDAALKEDVHELADMVERLSKEARRDKMRRVRAGEKVGATDPEAFPIPPGAEGIVSAETSPVDKAELRRRTLAARRIGA